IPFEYFWITGLNGRHLCIVLPLLGPSVSRAACHYRKEPVVLKDICGQLVRSMYLMYSKGLCHGDFRPSNILFRTHSTIDDLTQEEMLQLELLPVKKCISDLSRPGHKRFILPSIVITDFGVAEQTTGIPPAYGAPEDFLCVGPLGYTTDIWSLAATMFAVVCGTEPFPVSLASGL
ncbi:kinase-like domain-containing protein, partial [Achaetomium macrosporum]